MTSKKINSRNTFLSQYRDEGEAVGNLNIDAAPIIENGHRPATANDNNLEGNSKKRGRAPDNILERQVN
jgi:hypothetical protein